MSAKKMILRICDVLRRKSLISVIPTIQNLKNKGQEYFNIEVHRIVLEDEGIEVLEDEVVEMCAIDKKIFMLLSVDQDWSPPHVEQIVQIVNSEIPGLNGNQEESLLEILSIETVDTFNDPSPNATRKRAINDDDVDQTPIKRAKREHSSSQPDCSSISTELPGPSTASPSIPTVFPGPSTSNVVPGPAPRNVAACTPTGGISNSFQLNSFTVDWNLISAELKNEMKNCVFNGSQLSVQTYNRLTAQIVEQVRRITSRVSFKTFLNIASDAVRRYPILIDTDEKGNIIGNGVVSFAEKLRNHNNYLNRFHKSQLTKKSNIAKGKSVAGIKESYYNSGSSDCSKNLLVTLRRCTEDSVTDNLLESTLRFLRYKLDNTPITQLVAEIPLVRSYKFILHHFMAATENNPANFDANFTESRRKIIKALNTRRRARSLPSATVEQVFEELSSAFKESFRHMFREFEEGTELNDVDIDVPYPTILKFDDGDDRELFYIITDNVIVTEAVHSFVDCIKLCIMIYFVYYIKYPSRLSKTLEFIQMYLFKLLPEESRVATSRKICGQQKAVLALIRKVSNVKVSDDEHDSTSDEQNDQSVRVPKSPATSFGEAAAYSNICSSFVSIEYRGKHPELQRGRLQPEQYWMARAPKSPGHSG